MALPDQMSGSRRRRVEQNVSVPEVGARTGIGAHKAIVNEKRSGLSALTEVAGNVITLRFGATA